MRKYTSAFVLSLFACFAQGQTFTNGQAARAVIGQQEFSFGAAGTQQNLLGGASGVAYANGLLLVADSNVLDATPNNNRVLIFDTTQIPPLNADLTQYAPPSPYCGLCGYNAINVLGEPDYVSAGPQTVSSQAMSVPTAVATDGHILAVADTDNNRILIWNSIPSSIDQAANIVLGNASFATPGPPTATQSTFRGPQGVWIQNGKLFVADTQNYRILIWNSIPTHNDQPADIVLGQANFTTGTQPACNPTQGTYTTAANEFCDPVSVTSDGTRLFVSDFGFNRVLIWNSIPTSNNQPADFVVGQPNMTQAVPDNPAVCSNGAYLCAGTLSFPRFALSDGTRLFIADGGNDRVLIFNSIPTANGAQADAVLGQPDLSSDVVTDQSGAIVSTAIDNTGSVDTIPSPTSLAWDGSNLYVADPFNRRVLIFTPAQTPLPDNSIVNWASEIIRQEGVVTISVVSGASITANDTVTVTLGNASSGTTEPYTYTIKSSDTVDTIAQGLVTAINANGGDANATAIFAGTGTGSIYLSSNATNLGFGAISLSATTSNPANELATPSGADLTAGTAATGAPGMLVEIDGTNLSDEPTALPAVAPPDAPLPISLAGAQVFMEGFAAPILSVSATQIIAQIPYTYTNGTAAPGSTSPASSTDRNSVSVYVRTVHNDGSVTITNASPVYIAPANPGLFNAPGFAGQQRPWPATGAVHQSGNPNVVISVGGSITAGNTATITISGRNYTYTVVASDSITSIIQSLVNLINNAPDPQVTAAAIGAYDILITAIQSGAAGNGISVSTTTSSTAAISLTAFSGATCCVVTPGSAITPSNPAVPGELITVNAAGLGLLSNSVTVVAGQPYNGPQPNSVSNGVIATMNGTTAEVANAGLATGAIGIYQVQLIVPSTLSANAATPFYIAQNSYVSNIVTIPVGAATLVPTSSAPPNPMAASIDAPGPQSPPYSGSALFGGWALDNNAYISSVNVFVDGVLYGSADYGGNRPDACAAYPSSPNCQSGSVGWDYVLDTTSLADGMHRFQITANGTDGLHFTLSASFSTANPNPNNPTKLYIDQPGTLSNPFQGVASFSGWAVNLNAAIASVSVSIDGSFIGTATYGTPRADVCVVYPGAPGCPNLGWSILVDTSKVSNGAHTLTVVATATNGERDAMASTFNVANWSTANPMTITVDTPNAQSAAFRGANNTFGGWAVDSDAQIAGIAVRIDGVSYGNAAYGGVRSDVCNALPGSPGCPNVGWSINVDTTGLSDGAHTLAVTGTTITGQSSTVTRTFSVVNLTGPNSLNVVIDAPGPQSPALSGTALVGGWTLSTSSNITNVQVLVDGLSSGSASYGGNRADACAQNPSSPNCPNVGWSFFLDTTLLANGAHTLEVTSTSASGERGTASASFTVANPTPNGPLTISIDRPNSQSNPFQGLAQFSGWAVDTNTTVSVVAISIDGVPYTNATPSSRPDVCNAYPAAHGCPNVGWTITIDTTRFADGNHTLDVTAYGADGVQSTTSATFRIANWAIPNPMTIDIDSPWTSGGPYFGGVMFGGWVVDQNGSIASVSVAIDGVPFPGASYGGNRSDVCASLPGYPGCPNVGWDFFFDTTLVANGNHTLAVTATTNGGQSSTVTRSFTVTN